MKDFLEKILTSTPNFLLVFGAVFSGPKAFIAERRMYAKEEWVDALTFLAICSALSALAQILTTRPSEHGDLWATVGGNVLLTLIALALGATALRISWSSVGGRTPARSFFITYAYTFGVSVVINSIFQLLSVGVFNVTRHSTGDWVTRLDSSDWVTRLDGTGALLIAMAIQFIGFAAVCAWIFIAWGAYRQLSGLTRVRSFFALIIAAVLSLPITVIVLLIEQALGLHAAVEFPQPA
jgi:hypothetical protein